MTTVAESLVTALADLGVRPTWGVVGDALNPVTDAIRREERMTWIGVRHEEVGAFAASAQAQLSGVLGVCLGTVGPGSIHLLNGLYDAAKSHAPVLAICGQVPRAEIGSDYFQEVDNDLLFRDVAAFRATVTSVAQLPRLLEQAVNSAYARPGVAVLTLPGDVGGLDLPSGSPPPRFVTRRGVMVPDGDLLDEAARRIDAAGSVTILAGTGAAASRAELLALADRLGAPMILTLKAKPHLERDNQFQVGQSGLIGNPATTTAFDGADLLLMVGTDFPYPEWLPTQTETIQIDTAAERIGRRTSVDLGLVGHATPTLQALLDRVAVKPDRSHLNKARTHYQHWQDRQQALVDSGRSGSLTSRLVEKVRGVAENPHKLIRPEAVAAAIDRHATDNAIFTSDTGMSTVWLSRFIHMHGDRRLIGSYNLGSMANAMPHALGAQALDRSRQVVGLCGDGGITMLLGDLLTAVTQQLPVRLIVFNNGRLGMVKLEQEQVGLPEFGTILAPVDLAAIARAMGLRAWRVEDVDDLDAALTDAFSSAGPTLVDVVTNPDEIALPPHVKANQTWGFAIAKIRETLTSSGDG